MNKLNKTILAIATLIFLSVGNNLFAEEHTSVEFNGISFSTYNLSEFDRLIMNPYSKMLDYGGTALEIVTILAPSVMFMAPVEDYWKIGIEYTETLLLAFGVKELAKHLVNRARPYMYFENPPLNHILDGDWNNSFFSGHTTLSFAAASFTAVKLCQYFPDEKWIGAAITGTFTLAAATGVLRLMSGNHFLSDVLLGALVGSAIGVGVPLLNSIWFKPSRIGNTNINLSPLGVNLTMKF